MTRLGYLELTSYVSLGLGAFRLISQFVIRMIAIFAREEFSSRAFKVLETSWLEHVATIFHGKTGG